jgi:hypothetical protein
MATSWVEVCNLAFTALGSQPITAFPPTDVSQNAKLAQACYQELADGVLSSADFACAEWRQSLAAGTTPSEDPEWTYQFQLPLDFLRLRRISPSEATYERSGNQLFCNEASPTLIYTRKITDPTLLDALVAAAIGARIAWHLAPKIVQKTAFTQDMKNTYFGLLLEASMAEKGKKKVDEGTQTTNVLQEQSVEEIG